MKKIIINSIVIATIISASMLFFVKYKEKDIKTNSLVAIPTLTTIQTSEEGGNKITEENAPNLAEKEIYGSPFVKHIRVALNGYLDGSKEGIEDDLVISGNNDLNCGLAKFDKSYYKSKFIVLNSGSGEYGGRITNITFIDNPDTIFWAWVYQYSNGEYVLRGFCENGGLKEESKTNFLEMIKAMMKDGKFQHSL